MPSEVGTLARTASSACRAPHYFPKELWDCSCTPRKKNFEPPFFFRGMDDDGSQSLAAQFAEVASPFRVPKAKLDVVESPDNLPLPEQPSEASSSNADSSVLFDTNLFDALRAEFGGDMRCSCRSSKCSKMYCECFANNRHCTDKCGCNDCENCEENEPSLKRTREGIIRRNPQAFMNKVRTTHGTRRHAQGCRCTKSKCLKRYCECFREGMQCSNDCRCTNCHNGRESFSELPELGIPRPASDELALDVLGVD